MKLYLDACCLARLTDDQTQPRIRDEAEAVERILRLVRLGEAEWISSVAVSEEIVRNPDTERRHDVEQLLSFASSVIVLKPAIVARAIQLERLGYDAFDALHLSCAEHAGVDVLLTTDDRFLRRAKRGIEAPGIPVSNPLSWWSETFA